MPLGLSLVNLSPFAEPVVDLRPLRILLVDDDQVDRMAVIRAVGAGLPEVTIEQTDRAATALERLRRERFDCILLDYRLPDGDGGDVLRELASESGLAPPVIMLTRQGSDSIAVSLLKAGAADYLPKNHLTPESIARCIRNALRLREAETAVQRAHADLERRVIERTLALESANRRLESEMAQRLAAETKARRHLEQLAHLDRVSTLGEMAAALAHEIHQPLGAIVNYARGCERLIAAGSADPQVLAETLGKITAQAERAATIVRRQRELACRRELCCAPAEIGGLIREVVELLSAQTHAAGVAIEVEVEADLPPVVVDPIQIQQVVLNLLRNGLEAMAAPCDGERRLTVCATQRDDDRVEVAVVDRGCGWPAAEIERLFDSFFSTKLDGMGLGLSICRSIVETHGGQLLAEPNPERGLTLRFDLPTSPGETFASKPPDA